MSRRVKNPERKCRDCGARCEKYARFCKRCWRKRKNTQQPSN